MSTVHIDAYTERPCSRCGRKTTTFSAPNSDKGLCANCIVAGMKKSGKTGTGKAIGKE